ncbi:MAG: hypothetical protein M1115_01295 [Actinobacteria bacterium]|nr:hypothetical protein [Actinomycetota bacterium]
MASSRGTLRASACRTSAAVERPFTSNVCRASSRAAFEYSTPIALAIPALIASTRSSPRPVPMSTKTSPGRIRALLSDHE